MSNLHNFNCICNNKNDIQDAKNISLDKFSISIDKKVLFQDSSLKLIYGEKYGFIGKNGCGKTTLLKHLAQKVLPLHKDIDILYVEQEVLPSEKTAFQTILESNKYKYNLIKKRDNLEKKLEESNDDKVLDDLQKVEEELVSLEVEKDESIIRKLLKGLGFSEADQDKATKDFSGGWRMRISIARALYLKPAILLLDEPTNHLDLNANIWLTWYLESWKGSLLIVSHDQGFLNDVCTQVINIEDKKLEYYKGNFHKFTQAYKQKLNHAEKEWEKVEKTVRNMKKKSTPKKDVLAFITKREKEGIVKPDKEYIVNIDFEEVNDLARPVIEMSDVSFGYSEDKVLFENINFGMDMDSRITLVGPNGIGKSTFLKLIVGELNAKKGYINRNNKLRIGYYHQHFDNYLPMDQTPIEYIMSVYKPGNDEDELAGSNLEQFIRKHLGKISLEGNAHTKLIKSLSGGQKARVALVSLILQRPHILMLDEPTNHLDIESINGLINGINNFNGGVFIISHDSELITQTDSVLWVVDKKGIQEFDGDYYDYRNQLINILNN